MFGGKSRFENTGSFSSESSLNSFGSMDECHPIIVVNPNQLVADQNTITLNHEQMDLANPYNDTEKLLDGIVG